MEKLQKRWAISYKKAVKGEIKIKTNQSNQKKKQIQVPSS